MASTFHGCALGLHLAFAGEADADAVRAALAEGPFLELSDRRDLGPIDAAGVAEIQVFDVAADGGGRAGSYWLRAVFDNFTRGGALNAVAIVEALSALETH